MYFESVPPFQSWFVIQVSGEWTLTFAQKSMSEAAITNALLRCTRDDDLARKHFDLVREDLGLWVLELPESFSDIFEALSGLRSLLRSLADGGSDYTLHLAATVDEIHRLRIPNDLAALSADCGFSIEVIASPM